MYPTLPTMLWLNSRCRYLQNHNYNTSNGIITHYLKIPVIYEMQNNCVWIASNAEEQDDADGQAEEVQCTETEVETDLGRMGFTVGDLFFNYEGVSKQLEAYERSTFTEFWKRDARTVAAATK